MENITKKIAVYSRKSKITLKGESIENQIELCKKYIEVCFGSEMINMTCVYEDEGFSGGNLNRPQFQVLMRDARAGKISHIVVYRLDRISRDVSDFVSLINELNQLDISFISISEKFDTDSPMGRAMMMISSVFAQFERETITARIRDNMHELAKTGRWLGGVTPTGFSSEIYTTDSESCKKRKISRLKPIPEEVQLVRLIYTKYLEVESLTQTETYLLQNGYTTKNSKPFSRHSIKAILSNPVYLTADSAAYHYLSAHHIRIFSDQRHFDGLHGMMIYNRTFQQSGKSTHIRDKTDWIAAVGMHPGLISSDMWIRVQHLLERNSTKSYHVPSTSNALLSGLLFCGCCGKSMRSKTARGISPEGCRNYYYLCTTKEKSRMQLCSIKNPDGINLDRIILKEIYQLPENTRQFRFILHRASLSFKNSPANLMDSSSHIDECIIQNKRLIDNYVQKLGTVSGTSAESYLLNQINLLHKKNVSLKHQKDLLMLQKTSSTSFSEIKNQLDCMADSFSYTIDSMTTLKKRAVLRQLIEKIVWDGEVVHLYFHSHDKAGSAPL